MRALKHIIIAVLLAMAVLPTEGHAVYLIRILGMYSNSALNHATYLPQAIYYSEIKAVLSSTSSLNDDDQITLLETEFERLNRNSFESNLRRVDSFRRLIEDQLREVVPEPQTIYKGLNQVLGNGTTASVKVYRNMQSLAFYYQLLNWAYWLRESSPNHSPKVFEFMENGIYALIRHELNNLDIEIKKVEQLDPKRAEELATGVMAILLSGESPSRALMLDRLFSGLSESFSLNVVAARHTSRLLDIIHNRVLDQVEWRALQVMGAAYGAALFTPDQTPVWIDQTLNWIGHAGGSVWGTVFSYQFFGLDEVEGIAERVDRVLNVLFPGRSEIRQGQLSRLLELSPDELKRTCERLMGKAN